MLIHWIWLARLPHITLRQKCCLLQRFRDPEDIFEAGEDVLAQVEDITPKALESLENKDLTQARNILRSCSEKNISILTYGDGAYPKRLKNIEHPPLVLYYKGTLPDWESVPVIAMVGTRKASAYGLQVAEDMGYQIASCGALVVSGGADGIDTMALRGAMQAQKKVVAVLGFGADVVYPAKNRELFAQIEKQGCLITEYAPGTPANSWNFPQRNRIISGLSAGVVVLEAPERSGALNTARHAADQGRDVFVVPGNVNSPNSAGSNDLLRQRAIPVFTGWDVVREYESLYPGRVTRFEGKKPQSLQVAQEPVYPKIKPTPVKKPIDNREKPEYSVKDNQITLTEEEKAVLQCITNSPRPMDEIIADSQLPSGKTISVLTMLAMKGVVKKHPGNCLSRKS